MGPFPHEKSSACRRGFAWPDRPRRGAAIWATGASRPSRPTSAMPELKVNGQANGSRLRGQPARCAGPRSDRRHGRGVGRIQALSATMTAGWRSRSRARSRSITTVFPATITAAISCRRSMARCRPGSAGSRSARPTARPMRWRHRAGGRGLHVHRQSECDVLPRSDDRRARLHQCLRAEQRGRDRR